LSILLWIRENNPEKGKMSTTFGNFYYSFGNPVIRGFPANMPPAIFIALSSKHWKALF